VDVGNIPSFFFSFGVIVLGYLVVLHEVLSGVTRLRAFHVQPHCTATDFRNTLSNVPAPQATLLLRICCDCYECCRHGALYISPDALLRVQHCSDCSATTYFMRVIDDEHITCDSEITRSTANTRNPALQSCLPILSTMTPSPYHTQTCSRTSVYRH
jgi:hypothetical protein